MTDNLIPCSAGDVYARPAPADPAHLLVLEVRADRALVVAGTWRGSFGVRPTPWLTTPFWVALVDGRLVGAEYVKTITPAALAGYVRALCPRRAQDDGAARPPGGAR